MDAVQDLDGVRDDPDKGDERQLGYDGFPRTGSAVAFADAFREFVGALALGDDSGFDGKGGFEPHVLEVVYEDVFEVGKCLGCPDDLHWLTGYFR